MCMSTLELLLEKVKKNQAIICILGLGRVGLPLATIFATKGFKSLGIDIDQKKLDSIKKSICPFFFLSLRASLN